MGYRTVFAKPHALFIVVHAINPEQARRNAFIAFKGGADGVFLINHEITAKELLECYDVVRNALPNEWIGLNFLDRPPIGALELLEPGVQMLWCDDGGVDDTGADRVMRFDTERTRWESDHARQLLYFGSFAFKGQLPVRRLEDAARLACHHLDVITTSGPATGSAPDLDKIRRIRNAQQWPRVHACAATTYG